MRKRGLRHYNMPVFLILLLVSVVMIFPFIWMVLSAFKTNADVYAYPIRWLPSSFEWSNFQKVFQMVPFLLYYWNTILTSVLQTAIQIAMSIGAAYAFAKLHFPFKRTLYMLIQSAMFVPMSVLVIPLYQMDTRTKSEGRKAAKKELLRIGVSKAAVESAFRELESLTDSMRGAIVMDAVTGERLDDRAERGVRCSNMDCEDTALYEARMAEKGLGGDHPREALVLASKVAYGPGTVAELCWSDDPDYVTGYVGSKKFGYGRITVMKDMGDPVGGRVFFVEHGTDVARYDDYMQNQVVLVRMEE